MSGWGDRSLDNQETNSWTTFAKKASRSNNNHQDSYQQNRGRGQGMPQRGRGRGRGGYYGDRSQQYNNNQRQGSWNNNQQRDNNNWSSTRNDNNSQSQDQSWSNNNAQQDTQRNGWGSNSQSSANNNNQESNSWGSNSYEAKPTTTSNNWGNDNVEASNGWGNNKTATSNTAGAWGSDSQKPAFTPSNNNASGGWGAAAATKPATNQWAQPPAPATTNSSTNQWGESSTPAATNQWNQSTTPAASTNQWNQSSAPAAEPQSSAGEGWDDKPQSKDVQWGAVSLDDLGWNEKNKKSSLELSQGIWKDGRHILGEDNETLRLKLFGTLEDKENVHSGINFDKYDNIPVETKGDNVPEGITEFSNSGMDKHLLENIEMAHFKVPTPVQKHSIPIVMNGHGLMACAQTGSGKTAGFLFPILSAMFSNGPLEDPKEAPIKKGYQFYKKSYPQALILAPTRELASQIYKEAKKFCYRSYVRPCVAYGGADIGAQLRLIDRGCHILIATPGRLVDILERRRISFKNIQYLVLDEADRMLDMGFEPQVRRIVEGEDMPPATGRQTLMFSATFPEKIQRLARDFMASYVFLSVGRVGGTSDNITQEILWVKEEEKKKHLIEALENKKENQGLTLVFTQTKRMADSVCRFLNERNFPATAIHGDRIQSEREEALASFKKGITPIMVATAVAARGLDIPNVTHVISFDLPSDIDDYVHRIGRTGRAGNTGFATTFFASGDRFLAADLIKLLKDANQTVPSWLEEISREARSF